MKKLLLMAALFLGSLILNAAPSDFIPKQDGNSICRDSYGRITGSVKRDGDRIVYRDAYGRVTGSARESGRHTTFRDAHGRIQGSASY